MQLYTVYFIWNCSTCFGWYFHPSSGAQTTVSTASGICHTVNAIWRYCGRAGTGLSVLWVAYATRRALKPVKVHVLKYDTAKSKFIAQRNLEKINF